MNNGPNAHEFGISKTVPDGISASDWAAIRAAHQAAPKGSRLAINELARTTALVADKIAQQAYLKASNSDASDSFGIAGSLRSAVKVI